MTAHPSGSPNPNGQPVVAITGASGYLGSVLVAAFGSAGYTVRRLVRSPVQGSGDRRFDLSSVGPSDALDGVDLLVHCAYDMALTKQGRHLAVERVRHRRAVRSGRVPWGSPHHRAVVDVGVRGDSSAVRPSQTGDRVGRGWPVASASCARAWSTDPAGVGWQARCAAWQRSPCFPTSARAHGSSPLRRTISPPPWWPWPGPSTFLRSRSASPIPIRFLSRTC